MPEIWMFWIRYLQTVLHIKLLLKCNFSTKLQKSARIHKAYYLTWNSWIITSHVRQLTALEYYNISQWAIFRSTFLVGSCNIGEDVVKRHYYAAVNCKQTFLTHQQFAYTQIPQLSLINSFQEVFLF